MKRFSGYIILLAFLFVLSLLFYVIDEIYIPRAAGQKIEFEVREGEGADSIIERLNEGGLIRSKFIVGKYVVAIGIHKDIKPGVYTFGPSYSVKDIFDAFVKGVEIKVQVLEGRTIKEIAKELETTGVIKSASEFETLAKSFDNSGGKVEFLPQESGLNLEGYLFPDTYKFNPSSAQVITEKMLANFEAKVVKNFGNIPFGELNRLIIMASMLEREVQTEEDMRLVSGILWKRLEVGVPLQVDATLVYIKCDLLGALDCRTLSNGDKKIESRFNTYLVQGLPPSPISNPGFKAINAALSPKDSPYLYYLSAKEDGRTIFAKTLDEHNANRLIYR